MGSCSFPKTERLLNRKDFVNLIRSGKRYHTEHYSVTLGRNGLGRTRLGVTASKRIGNAVERNRVKRLVREFFRLHKCRLPSGVDIVVTGKKGASGLDLSRTSEELGAILLDKNHYI
ncbi:MAG: ribonuclease P protein component [Desulfobacteraceae bacterium]